MTRAVPRPIRHGCLAYLAAMGGGIVDGSDGMILGALTTLAAIESLHLPQPVAGSRGTYLKAMNRKVWAFALVGVAAVVRLEGARVADARIVLNGVAPIPWRVESAERELIGRAPDAALFERAAAAAVAEAHPLHRNAYKVDLTKSLIRQALESITAP